MDKKLTKVDILVAFGIIFSLIVGVGAFFFGLQIGKEQTDAKYKTVVAELTEQKNLNNVSYQQQQLVSFYHTVLIPFREFQNTWFQHMERIAAGSGAVDANALLKELGRLAKEKSKDIQPTTTPSASNLLIKAQENYLKSLTLFADATDRLQGKLTGPRLLETVRNDGYVIEASHLALEAQSQYYEAIWEWYKGAKPDADHGELTDVDNLTLEQWRQLPLNGKNLILSNILLSEGEFHPFYPQDVTARLDELDAAGGIERLHLSNLKDAVATLMSTGAVRPNDFVQSKDKYYRNETLPQLPFFFGS